MKLTAYRCPPREVVSIGPLTSEKTNANFEDFLEPILEPGGSRFSLFEAQTSKETLRNLNSAISFLQPTSITSEHRAHHFDPICNAKDQNQF